MGTLLFYLANLASLHAYTAHLPHQNVLLVPHQLTFTTLNAFLLVQQGIILCCSIILAKFANLLALLVHPQLNVLLVLTIIFMSNPAFLHVLHIITQT